jgi:DNA polymerase-4
VTVKIRRKDFQTFTRQAAVRPPTQETRTIAQAACHLLDTWLKQQPRAAIRLLGVGASDLTSAPQLELFVSAAVQRDRRLDEAVDSIRAKFGSPALTRASALPQRGRKGLRR